MVYDLALDDSVFITDDVTAALQELDLLFNTDPTEVLGNTSYGLFLEQFLWNLNPDTERLKGYIQNKLNTECYYLNKFDYEVKVYEADDSENMKNIIGDIQCDPSSTYIILINLYDKNSSGIINKHKYSTKIIQF